MSAAMRFDVFTLFPDIFNSYLNTSILLRARERGLVAVHLHNIRDWTTDRHHVTDDEPYGGGGGMIMKPEPIFAAVEDVLGLSPGTPPDCPVILLTPQGRLFNQQIAWELAAPALPRRVERSAQETLEGLGRQPRIALIAGRYEGVDERVREHLVTDELSIGDYVLTGGELPALVVIDAVTRLLPGVLGDPEGPLDDSHALGLLEYPHYTRPPVFRGWAVPDTLLSGDHARIARWRREQSLRRTWERRPELLAFVELTEADRRFLSELEAATPGTPNIRG